VAGGRRTVTCLGERGVSVSEEAGFSKNADWLRVTFGRSGGGDVWLREGVGLGGKESGVGRKNGASYGIVLRRGCDFFLCAGDTQLVAGIQQLVNHQISNR
jgi:hypothetical protein